jgi:hypothetical protein
MDNNLPVMYVHTERNPNRSDTVISLVGKCPFCKKTHYHGGGTDMSNLRLGSRCSHCWTIEPREYNLVLDVLL